MVDTRAPGFTEYTEFEHSDDDEGSVDAGASLLGRGDAFPPPRASGFWGIWKNFLRARAIESARMNHQYTAEEKQRMSELESIDYLAPNSAVYRKWLAKQPHRRFWDRWIMMGTIGIAMGLVASCLDVVVESLARFKFTGTRWLILKTNVGVAWLFNAVLSVSLAAGSSYLVVFMAPEAVGSGIPEVMAYLNGVLLPKVFNIFTVVVKFFSCGLAVASGLPVGPEGPLIHIGAALGAALSQGHSTTLGITTGIFKRFRNPKDKRDFVTAGVAVGVAAAFNAPIGGLLFAFEDVASFWQHALGWQVFFACMCAVLALNLSRSVGAALLHSGSVGWFNHDVVFEVGMELSGHILAVVPAAIIGLVAGLGAVIFTILNIKIARVRAAITATWKNPWRRLVEPCVICLIYVTGSMVLPLVLSACTPTKCVVFKGQVHCGVTNATATTPEDLPPLPLVYTCSNKSPGSNTSWIPDSGTITPDTPTNTTGTVYFNELATLTMVTGEEGIKYLMTRGVHRLFNYKALTVMLIWYFMWAAIVSGSAIASGLFVPMLMIGACIGRLIGLYALDMMHPEGGVVGGGVHSSTWSWLDPGVFALVGAGAFMGGVTRMTLSLAVIMIEISNDVHMLLPVLVAIMVAKWVADAVTHPLYHGLMEVKCVPFLSHEAASKYSLDLVPVSMVMKSPVVTMKAIMKVHQIQSALRDCTHHGFPVVRESRVGQVLVGLITRAHLMVLLQKIAQMQDEMGGPVPWGRAIRRPPRAFEGDSVEYAEEAARPPLVLEVTYPELNRKMMDPVVVDPASGQIRSAESMDMDWSSGLLGDVLDENVDLTPYMNTSNFKVHDNFSVERAYLVFRTMGLRHMVVVDDYNRVKGIITRKDLLGYKLDEAMGKMLRRVESSRNLGDIDWHITGVASPR